MKTKFLSMKKKQTGAATLFTAVMILIAITLVSFLSGKTVLNETKIAADNYRTSQAVAAANYAMDYGVNYFDSGGFDQDNNDTADIINPPDLASADGTQTTTATIRFYNKPGFAANPPADDDERLARLCVPPLLPGESDSFQRGTLTATGFSDDRLATRTITQCVGPIGLVKDDGPDQPLVAQGQVFVTGTANIVNRYTDTTIWSGGEAIIGSSSSMATYIKDSASGTLTLAELTSLTIADDTQLVSNRNLGNGLDIIDDDPSLANLTGLEFFKNFFQADNYAEPRNHIKDQADDAGQYFTDIADAVGKSGPIWVEGDQHLTGGTFGSIDPSNPAIIIINGNLISTGNSTIYGLLYVIGTYSIGGTINVIGSNVVEGTSAPVTMDPENLNALPAASPVVSGTGTLNLIFWPAFGDETGNPITGLTAVVAGSWRDW